VQEQRLHWDERSFTLQTQSNDSLSIADEEPFDISEGAEDRLALCKPPKVCLGTNGSKQIKDLPAA
jgi:hypothetical protein